jgi:hypothetical protein
MIIFIVFRQQKWFFSSALEILPDQPVNPPPNPTEHPGEHGPFNGQIKKFQKVFSFLPKMCAAKTLKDFDKKY